MEIKRKDEIILSLTLKEAEELKEALGHERSSDKFYEMLRIFLDKE